MRGQALLIVFFPCASPWRCQGTGLAPDATFPKGYPSGPDEATGLASGSLKKMAQGSGTYFTSESQFQAMLSANGGKMPDHKVVYCDFTPSGGSFDVGSGNAKSSMLIVHTDSGNGAIKNLHGNFTGALFADSIIHVNAGTKIVGMVQLFSPTASDAGNVFGNRRFVLLWTAQLLSQLASNMVLAALMATVVSVTGSTTANADLILTFLVPAVAFSV